jgi:hypothetical protein
MPITPAPTITIVDGTVARRSTMSSESRTLLPLKSISGGWAGSEPVAMTTARADNRRSESSRPSTASVFRSTKRAQPSRTVTWLRSSWSRMIWRSRSTTWRVRNAMSSIETLSLSR